MRINSLILIILLTPTICSAEKYVLIIENQGKVEKGFESGHNETGDVIDCYPAFPDRPIPTSMIQKYKFVTVDITSEECDDLLAFDEDESGRVRSRNKKLDTKDLPETPKEEITKNELFEKVINKSELVVNPD